MVGASVGNLRWWEPKTRLTQESGVSVVRAGVRGGVLKVLMLQLHGTSLSFTAHLSLFTLKSSDLITFQYIRFALFSILWDLHFNPKRDKL